MKFFTNRRKFIALLSATFGWLLTPAIAQQKQRSQPATTHGPGGGRGRRTRKIMCCRRNWRHSVGLSLVLGRVSDHSVTVSSLAKETIEGFFEYGTAPGNYANKTVCSLLPRQTGRVGFRQAATEHAIFLPAAISQTGRNRILPRGRNAAFTRNAPPAARSPLPSKATRIPSVRR